MVVRNVPEKTLDPFSPSCVHVCATANRFVKDPHEIVNTGQIVKVKVLEVNVKRRRISPTMRHDDAPGASSRTADTRGQPSPRDRQPPAPKARRRASPSLAAMALALEVTSGSKDGLTTAYRLPKFHSVGGYTPTGAYRAA